MIRGWPIPLTRKPPVGRSLPSPTFEAVWRLFTLALVLLGFLALAFTGELNPIVMILFMTFWLISLLRPPLPAWWRPWLGHVLVWMVLLAISTFALRLQFVSLLYLLLFLAVFKCLTLREPVDHIHAMLMAFFMLLACSIITNSISYIAFMLGFIVLAMLELACHTLAQEAERAAIEGEGEGGRNGDPAEERALLRRLFVGNVAAAVIALIVAQALFFLMPHYAAQRGFEGFARQAETEEAVSAFNENLDLGTLSRLSLDNTRVMTVEVAWEDDPRRPPPDHLRLRGSNLAVFDERGWRTTRPAFAKYSRNWRSIRLPLSVSERGPVLRQVILQNPLQIRRLFGAGDAFEIRLRPAMEVSLNWSGETVDVTRWAYAGPMRYEVRSVIMPDGLLILERMAKALAAAPAEIQRLAGAASIEPLRQYDPLIPMGDAELRLTEEEGDRYTQLPKARLSQIVRQLADQHVRGADVPTRILNLDRWFQAGFEYSLTPDTPPQMHPLEGFLLHTHKGHCEYFASAMALLLRAKGIPTRVVTGYYTTEFAAATRQFLVRQSDAHAWCEVWLDGLGWLTVDPTPPDYRGRASYRDYRPSLWKQLSEKTRTLWQYYILDYSNNAKAEFLARLVQRPLGEHLARLSEWLRRTLINNFSDQSLARRNVFKLGQPSLVALLRSLLAIVLLVALWLIHRYVRRPRRVADPLVSPVGFMNQLLRQLEEMGWRRRLGQTPAELVQTVERQTAMQWPLRPILDLYHRYRYAGDPPTADELAWVNKAMREIHR